MLKIILLIPLVAAQKCARVDSDFAVLINENTFISMKDSDYSFEFQFDSSKNF